MKKEEALKRSLEEKNSQIYIERSKVIHRILWLAPLALYLNRQNNVVVLCSDVTYLYLSQLSCIRYTIVGDLILKKASKLAQLFGDEHLLNVRYSAGIKQWRI